jgi:hypothetical protein
MSNPAIVIIAYNRPASLRRLLGSIANGQYTETNIPLCICIDKSSEPEVQEIAEGFDWKHGTKSIEISEEHLGLKMHVLKCGDLVEKYGAIIMLEDDLVVSPAFYLYAQKCLSFYDDEPKVAGVSLYSYEIAESCSYPFEAIRDNSDVYFMQIASSWGQAWSRAQWTAFRKWLSETGDNKLNNLPEYIQQWGKHSWKKYFINYLIEEGKYFVYPQHSYSTNFEDLGTNATTRDLFQVSIGNREKEVFFQPFDKSKSVYDAYFEIEQHALNQRVDFMKQWDYEVDLYGTKPVNKDSKEFFLTTKAGENPEKQFSAKMKPLVNNILYNLDGREIGLYRKDDLESRKADPSLFFSTSLLERVNRELSGAFDISIVVPIIDLDEEELALTLASIPKSSGKVECILVFDSSLDENVRRCASASKIEYATVNGVVSSEYEVLQLGLDACTHEIVTWIRPGGTIARDAFIQLPKIFQTFKQINWISGVDEMVTRKTDPNFSTAMYRWNLCMAKKYESRSSMEDTELMFFRKSVYDKARKSDGFVPHLMFYYFLKEEPLYVAAYNFGTKTNDERKKTTLGNFAAHLPTRSFTRRLISSMSYPFFKRNSSPLRLVFVETEHLPDVLRYDFENENFYLSRY